MVNRKVYGSGLIVVLLTVSLTGCFGAGETPAGEGTQTAAPIAEQPLLNPTVPGLSDPVASTIGNNLPIKVKFLGAGYPTFTEMETLSPGKKQDTPKNISLSKDDRVLGVSYTVTNITGEPADLNQFKIENATINNQKVPFISGPETLHAMLGVGAAPAQILTNSPTVQPGETATWGVDLLIPPASIGASKTPVSLTIVIDSTPITVHFTVDLVEKTIEKNKEIKNEQPKK